MRKFRGLLLVILLAGCGFATIADPYGNEYGGWYNPGANFQWQLNLCEQQMDARDIPASGRKLAMRCCMHEHGVPVDAIAGCGTASG